MAKATALAEAPRGPATPTELIQAAIDKGLDPAALKALTDWAKDLAASEARRLFNADMVACQAAMPSVVNDAQNPSTQSRYPKFETLLRATKPVWTQYGFSLSFATVDCPTPGMMRVVCDVRHRAGHVERYQADIGLDGIGPQGNPIGKMNKPQASGSTMAYGQRYLTKLIFCLAFADEDDDAVNARRTCLNEAQVAEIKDLIQKCEDAGTPVDEAAFLAWLAVEKIEELKQSEHPKATKELRRKLRKAVPA